MSVDGILDRAKALKATADILEQRIVDAKTREFFLRPVWNSLGDVEKFLLPNAAKSPDQSRMWIDAAQFALEAAEARLKHTQEMVSNYGTTLQLKG
jgi:hypothetical protein